MSEWLSRPLAVWLAGWLDGSPRAAVGGTVDILARSSSYNAPSAFCSPFNVSHGLRAAVRLGGRGDACAFRPGPERVAWCRLAVVDRRSTSHGTITVATAPPRSTSPRRSELLQPCVARTANRLATHHQPPSRRIASVCPLTESVALILAPDLAVAQQSLDHPEPPAGLTKRPHSELYGSQVEGT